MTKLELTQKHVFLSDKVFDFALPQNWVNELCDDFKIPYHILIGSFVWLYDDKAKIFGRPYPLNIAAWVVCRIAKIEI